MDPDQTTPVGTVWSGSTMFASMLMLKSHFQMPLFCWRFKDSIMRFCVYTEEIAQDNTITFDKTAPHVQLLPMSEVDQS